MNTHAIGVSEDLSEALTYPVGAFISREYAEAEPDRLWSKVWQQAGRVVELKTVGDYITCNICHDSILIVRDTPATLKACHNVCPQLSDAQIAAAGLALSIFPNVNFIPGPTFSLAYRARPGHRSRPPHLRSRCAGSLSRRAGTRNPLDLCRAGPEGLAPCHRPGHFEHGGNAARLKVTRVQGQPSQSLTGTQGHQPASRSGKINGGWRAGSGQLTGGGTPPSLAVRPFAAPASACASSARPPRFSAPPMPIATRAWLGRPCAFHIGAASTVTPEM